MPFAKVGDIRLYYEVDGKGDNLLLIHGVTGYLDTWKYVRQPLARDFRLVLPDLRGHGRSDKPNMRYSVEMFARDLVGLLDVLKIRQCIVAGHSLGGFIAQQMAVDAPERVRALILVCTAPKVDDEAVSAQVQIIKALFGLTPEQAVAKKMEIEYANPQKVRATPGMMELLLADETQRQVNQNAHGWAQGAAARFNIEDRLGEIQAPTLVIQGAQDATFPPRWGQYYREHIRGATVRIIDETSHSIQIEQPRALAEAIAEFGRTLKAKAH
jgi:pimeloyl-ACP methyl ester carboxylesterase